MSFHRLREEFLKAFVKAGFRRSPALSLVQPSINTSFLFSVGFVDVLEAIAGKSPHLDGAATVQRCFRHFDIERVSDQTHLSFFEMAGALRCSEWGVQDLITPLVRYLAEDCDVLKTRLHATYFEGGNVAGDFLPPDSEAREGYLSAGIAPDHIWEGNHSTNIWFEGANSGTERSGICGPHSELFFELAPAGKSGTTANPIDQPDRFVEVSNIVTITHRTRLGLNSGLEPLPRPVVELALGMERLEMVTTEVQNVHETPKLRHISDAVLLASESDMRGERFNSALRTTVDHVRAVTHLIADGGRPGAKGQGNVVRRVIKNLLRAADVLELNLPKLFPKIARSVVDVDDAINPNLSPNMKDICEVFNKEARRIQGRKSRFLA